MNNQNVISAGVVALVVSVLIGFFFVSSKAPVTSAPAQPDQSAQLEIGAIGFPVNNTPQIFLGGVGMGIGSANANFLSFSVDGVIAPGSAQSSWQNKTGRTVVIDLAEVYLPTGTASSSFRVSIGTSTASTINSPYTAPFSSLLDNVLLATSTAQTVVLNSNENQGTNGTEIIPVAPGQFVNVTLRQDNSNTTACAGTFCENSTSTARGFTNLQWYLRGHYKP